MCAYNFVVLCMRQLYELYVFLWRPANCISIVLLTIIFLCFWQSKVMNVRVTVGEKYTSYVLQFALFIVLPIGIDP